MQTMSGVEEFHSIGSGTRARTGVLVVHGITSTPQGMGPVSAHLAELGYAVSAPVLPGHGTSVKDMLPTRYDDWLARVEDRAEQLRLRCDRVVAVGMSLGGALATDLAARRPDLVDALVLINPGFGSEDPRLRLLPVLKHVMPTFPGLADEIRRPGPPRELAYERLPLKAFASLVERWPGLREDFAKVTQPVLLFRSAYDRVVPPSAARAFLDGVGSEDVTEVWLRDSGHVATLDYDQAELLQRTAAFVARIGEEP
jgi:carboxylesterase